MKISYFETPDWIFPAHRDLYLLIIIMWPKIILTLILFLWNMHLYLVLINSFFHVLKNIYTSNNQT